MNFSLANPSAALHFGGTGEDGKPRVVIGKAEYTIGEFDQFRQRDDIKIAGIATDSDELATMVAEQKPDVVILGSTFGDFVSNSPMSVVKSLLQQGVVEKIGVVVNSIFLPEEINAMNWLRAIPGAEDPLKYRHVPGREVDSEQMSEAVHAVDPYPTVSLFA